MSSGKGLTDADREVLADIAANGVQTVNKNGVGDEPPNAVGVEVTCHNCQYSWRYIGDKVWATCSQCQSKTRTVPLLEGDSPHGVPIGLCNAIRAAAHDGKSYGEIERLFSSIGSRRTARRHATGECQHGVGDYPPLTEERGPDFNQSKITADDCERLREGWGAGRWDTAADAAEEYGVHRTTIKRHVTGDCQH